MNDKTYEKRFIRCLMNHYKERYEIHSYQDIVELEADSLDEYDAILLADWMKEMLESLILQREKILYLWVEAPLMEFSCTQKHQEVYKIVEQMERQLEGRGDMKEKPLAVSNAHIENNTYRMIGVYSVASPLLQLPLASTLAEICGEKSRTILIDLQAFSGLTNTDAATNLEDVMVIATSGVYSKNRLLSAIGHKLSWDYIYPVKNSSCLCECNEKVYQKIKQLLIEELGYETLIWNLGEGLPDIIELSSSLEQLYLVAEQGTGTWREQQFLQELKERGKEKIADRITRIETPTTMDCYGEWEKIAKQWKWGSIGDLLRKSEWNDNKWIN